jgi:histo-blood group ABO system transferase
MFKKILMLLCCITFGPIVTFAEPASSKPKVGLCIVATGKYDCFVSPLLQSARTHFSSDLDVSYFIFTDGQIPEGSDIVKIHQPRLGWPYDTLKRFHIYDAHAEKLKAMDYLFACDADMLFVAPVGAEILGERVATMHGGFLGKRGTYETNKLSAAYVDKQSRRSGTYFAGAFYGGSSNEFLNQVAELKKRVDQDLDRNVIAIWHDESHLNRYYIDFKPTKVLSPSYCYLDGHEIPFEKKIVACQKSSPELLRK